MTPSPYQQAIYDWIEQGSGNALVDAVAVAGKTTVLIEGAKRIKTSNACFVAFNKIIAEEIATRLQVIGSPMQASTIHSLGKRCLGKVRIESNKYLKLSRRYLGGIPDVEIVLKDTPEAAAVKYLRTLVNFAQLTMTEPTEEHLLHLVLHYALDDLMRVIARNPLLWETIWSGVSVVMEMGIEQYQRERIIDFNDMVCLPTVLGTSKPQFHFLLVDEAQDLNRAQLELVLACTSPQGRLLFCGDSRQSLYSFVAADTESINTIIKRTQAQVLPLSICYRCPTLPIQLAQQIYPQIQPSPTAERGTVEIISQAEFLRQVQPTDGGCAVIGRCTAPLISLCLKLLRAGANGRKSGAAILARASWICSNALKSRSIFTSRRSWNCLKSTGTRNWKYWETSLITRWRWMRFSTKWRRLWRSISPIAMRRSGRNHTPASKDSSPTSRVFSAMRMRSNVFSSPPSTKPKV